MHREIQIKTLPQFENWYLPFIRKWYCADANLWSNVANGNEQWLEKFALMEPARALQRVKFIQRYRSYVINYNLGEDIIRGYIEKRSGGDAEKRWSEFAKLLSSPRLPSDVTKQTTKGEEQKVMKGANDFDFFIGEWRVHHRRLKERLANNHEWIEFDGTSAVRKILGGQGNMDDNVLDIPGGAYKAVTVRTYDPAKGQWSIWWFDSRYPASLDPPVVGRFENGVGTFYADDHFKGKPIRVRFLWTQHSDTPRWEQAFSTDGGKTWETNWTMDFTRQAMNTQSCCPVVELRQYTLHPGQRDVLIELFEREFIDSQEATGMKIIGTFRDLNNPDRFVWLRGFSDMPARAKALEEFYGGPVWKAHRVAANATMIDSSNVFLLRPAYSNSEFSLANVTRPPLGSSTTARGLVVATIYDLGETKASDFADLFEHEVRPIIEQTGASVLASFVTETHPNTFPKLPVRENANVFIWFSVFRDHAAWEQHATAFADSIRGKEITGKILKLTKGQPEVLLLAPTTRSLLAIH